MELTLLKVQHTLSTAGDKVLFFSDDRRSLIYNEYVRRKGIGIRKTQFMVRFHLYGKIIL